MLEMCKLLKDGIVNAEVVSTDTDGMLRGAREIASWHLNIVVKVDSRTRSSPDGTNPERA
ncbi:MAG: hypothetical protein ACRD10_14305 [Terriglobia bacterium]